MAARKHLVALLIASTACGNDGVNIDPDRPCVDEYVDEIAIRGDADPLEASRAREVGVLVVEDSDAVTLEGLGGCLERAHEVRIVGNAQLESLAGLESLAEIVASEPGNWDLLDNLPEWVDARLEISGNPALQSIDGLGSLEVVEGDIFVRGNDALADLDGLGALKRNAGVLSIDDNTALAATSLPELRVVFGALEIVGNNSLGELGPFSQEGTRLGGLVLADNAALTSADALQDRSVFDTLELRNLPRLARIPHLYFPTAFADSNTLELLVVEGCDALSDLAGLSRLTHSEDTAIRGNAALANIHGLEGVEGFGLVVHDNPNLVSLAALDASRDGALVSAELEITDNMALPTCEAESVAANLQPGSLTTIEGNNEEGTCPWLQ